MSQNVKRPVPLVFIMIFTVMISLTHLLGGYGPVFKGAANSLILGLGLLYFFMGLAGIVAVAGLWLLLSWANLLTRVIYMISIPIGIAAMLFDPKGGNVIIQLFNIGLNVWIIWYLMRADIRATGSVAKRQSQRKISRFNRTSARLLHNCLVPTYSRLPNILSGDQTEIFVGYCSRVLVARGPWSAGPVGIKGET